jgi:hypothetical protein
MFIEPPIQQAHDFSFQCTIPLTQPSNLQHKHRTEKTVHGGLVLTLTDTLGSLAIASKGNWMTGVSTDMGATFVRPAGRPGETLRIRANLTGIGESRRPVLQNLPPTGPPCLPSDFSDIHISERATVF